MSIRRPLPILLVLSLTVLARSGAQARPAGTGAWAGVVRVDGVLHAMMHEGKTQATVTLDSLLPDPHLYAIGALAGLSGEVTVIGGAAYLAYPVDSVHTRTERADRSSAGAALFVSSEVGAWKSVRIDRAIPFEKIDEEIARLANANGVATTGRVPFLVEGELENLEWHVIDGRRLAAGSTSHAEHVAASVTMKAPRAAATLVGFFSEKDQGVFTHIGSRTHIHCVVDDPLASGHVNHVVIPAGATLKFPL